MKLGIVSHNHKPIDSWHADQMLVAIRTLGHDGVIANPINADCMDLDDCDAIYWRSADIENLYPTVSERIRLLERLHSRGKIIINPTLFNNPYLSYKSVQQELISSCKSLEISTINSYVCADMEMLQKLIQDEHLQYPFIAKPNHGSQGRDVHLIKSDADFSEIDPINQYILQNFISNSGDYRVYVVGGEAVAMIQRVGSDDSFLNNISQGGSAHEVTDENTRNLLAKAATAIADHLGLYVCGVDIICDDVHTEWYFLEINTVAQWQGLQQLTGIPVSEKIAALAIRLVEERD